VRVRLLAPQIVIQKILQHCEWRVAPNNFVREASLQEGVVLTAEIWTQSIVSVRIGAGIQREGLANEFLNVLKVTLKERPVRVVVVITTIACYTWWL
jgi:hypothetical protein